MRLRTPPSALTMPAVPPTAKAALTLSVPPSTTWMNGVVPTVADWKAPTLMFPVAPASTRVAAAPDIDCVRSAPAGLNLPYTVASRPEARVAVPPIVREFAVELALMACAEESPAFCVEAHVATAVLSSLEASAR